MNQKAKRLLAVFLSICMLLSITAGLNITALASTSGDYEYTVLADGTAEITDYTGSDENVTIPSKLDDYIVTSIGMEAFMYKSVGTVKIPDSVKSIGEDAFRQCLSLWRVVIDNGLTNIGVRAFYDCHHLVSIIIPNSVKTIERGAFNCCSDLEDIYFVGNEGQWNSISIGEYNLELSKANVHFTDFEYRILDDDTAEITAYTGSDSDVVIPSTLAGFTVTSIGDDAFFGCKSLTNITIPNSVISIGNDTFSNCTSLTSIIIPDSVTRIGNGAFCACESLTSIVIPNSVTSMGGSIFAACKSLTTVTLTNNVTSIDDYMFWDCTSLTSITIPNGITNIGECAFYRCDNLTDIYFNGTEKEWISIEIGDGNEPLLNATIHFAPDVVPEIPFADLGAYESYDTYIRYTSVYNNFIKGTNPPAYTEFSPTTAITRAMFVTILYRMAGSPYDSGNPHKTSPFTDITNTSVYYYDAACWALDNGITTEKTFKPNDLVVREQTAAFLFRYASNNGFVDDSYTSVDLTGFTDFNTVSKWAVPAMQWANQQGMITGTQQGTLNPKGSTLRIHATKILYGFGCACGIGNGLPG